MRLSLLSSCVLGALSLTLFSGCGYVHFGRNQMPAANDPALVVENTDLRTEQKILKQELGLARKEGQALRDALENRQLTTGDQNELAKRLHEVTTELGTVRASYAKLQAQRSQPASGTMGSTDNFGAAEQIANLKTELGISKDKLAQSLRAMAPLQQENTQLREEVDRVRHENAGLTVKVQTLTSQNEQVSAALTQLNNELLAQKVARQRAEDAASASKDQLQLVLARQTEPGATTLSAARLSSARSANDLDATIRMGESDPTTAPVAVLRTSPERLQQTVVKDSKKTQYHIVVEGDTLEGIAKQYYDSTKAWRSIYAANNALLRGGRPIKVGMRLVIPPM